jgi:hypothetical protein
MIYLVFVQDCVLDITHHPVLVLETTFRKLVSVLAVRYDILSLEAQSSLRNNVCFK